MLPMSRAMRFFFFFVGSVVLLGIGLTGFKTVHWLLYVPVVFLYFATLTGICPGINIAHTLFPDRPPAKSKSKKRK